MSQRDYAYLTLIYILMYGANRESTVPLTRMRNERSAFKRYKPLLTPQRHKIFIFNRIQSQTTAVFGYKAFEKLNLGIL